MSLRRDRGAGAQDCGGGHAGRNVDELRSQRLGPASALLVAAFDLRHDLSASEQRRVFANLHEAVRSSVPGVTYVYLGPSAEEPGRYLKAICAGRERLGEGPQDTVGSSRGKIVVLSRGRRPEDVLGAVANRTVKEGAADGDAGKIAFQQLRDAVLAHPTMAEEIGPLFATVPLRSP